MHEKRLSDRFRSVAEKAIAGRVSAVPPRASITRQSIPGRTRLKADQRLCTHFRRLYFRDQILEADTHGEVKDRFKVGMVLA